MWKIEVKHEIFTFYRCLKKSRILKWGRKILDFTDVQENVENKGKAGRFYILQCLKYLGKWM